MAEPVAQNDKGNFDYIPTQVLADFLPDYGFADGPIDGISYVTALGLQSFNTVLFATSENVTDDIGLSIGGSRRLVLSNTEVRSG